MKRVLDRRKFIQYSLTAGLLFPLKIGSAEGLMDPLEKHAGIIDIHHHIVPEVYIRSLAKRGITAVNNAPFPRWDEQKAMAVMDRNGIRAAVTSVSAPGVFFGDTGFAVDLARRCNEFSAGLIRRHPKRFGGFAVLPLPDRDAALKELIHALDVLKLDGVVLLSNVDGTYLGDPLLDDLYEALNRRKTIVYVHPTEPAGSQFPKLKVPPSFFEFMFDTTRTVADLIGRDIPGRFPDITFIIAHAGGTAPYLAWKMSLTARISGSGENRAVSHLQDFYYDTALSTSRYSLGLLSELAGVGHILFGSDLPFAPEFLTASCLYELENNNGFNSGELKKICTTNAAELFPRFNA